MPPVDEIAMDCYECHHHHHYDEETKESISTNNEYSNEIPSSAQALVQTAAYKIDLDPSKLDVLLQNMKEELVTETWQLDFMDFPSWRAMGFPVGLIASIKAVKKEQEDVEESDRKKSMSQRTGVTEYSSQLVESKAARLDTNAEEEGQLKRRISDITMSERYSFGKTRELMMSPPPPNKNAFSPRRLNVQSEHKPKERRMYSRVGSAQSLFSDTPPVAVHRRSSSSKSKANPNTRSPRPGRKKEEQIKNQRRSSITMPLCPPRRPTYTDLASLTKGIDDPSEVESFAADSLAKSKALSETDDVSLELGSMITGSKPGEIIENLEKSMDTIITGNLGLGNAWDAYIEDELTNNEEEKEDDHDHEEEGSLVSVDDNSFTLLRRYTIR